MSDRHDPAPGFRHLGHGHGPRPRPRRPDLPPSSLDQAKQGLRDWRGLGWVLALGVVFALGPCLPGWVARATKSLEGEGYVRWRYPAWKAKSAAVKLELPLVIVRADEDSPAYQRFRDSVLADPRVQAARGNAVWLHEAAAGPPTLRITRAEGVEELHEPVPLDRVLPAALAAWILEADEAE